MAQFRKQVNKHQIRQWEDGFYHVYAPNTRYCEMETLSLPRAIEFAKSKHACKSSHAPDGAKWQSVK